MISISLSLDHWHALLTVCLSRHKQLLVVSHHKNLVSSIPRSSALIGWVMEKFMILTGWQDKNSLRKMAYSKKCQCYMMGIQIMVLHLI
jgi:hypothetical protein